MNSFKQKLTTGLSALMLAGFMTGNASAQSVQWDVAAHFPTSMPLTGEAMKRMSDLIATMSGDEIQLNLAEPGALVPPSEILQSVRIGAIQAGFSAPGFWAGQEPALQIFGGLPFGPSPDEFLAWFYAGEGRQLYDELYAQFDIHAIPCGVIPAEAAGWFNKEIASAEDFSGLKIRIFGLGGLVMEKFGASPQLLSVGDTVPALELGTIDAAEMVVPSIDYQLGFHNFAENYYFPGWHQRTTFTDLLINMAEWEALDERQQTIIETACGDNVRYSYALGLASQPDGLDSIEAEGKNISRLPDEVVEELREAWEEVATAQSEESPAFAKAYESLIEFVERQDRWNELQALD
jgi:TRAP-type mannitol/chloroaromatic compound transport system substrate-binding protein